MCRTTEDWNLSIAICILCFTGHFPCFFWRFCLHISKPKRLWSYRGMLEWWDYGWWVEIITNPCGKLDIFQMFQIYIVRFLKYQQNKSQKLNIFKVHGIVWARKVLSSANKDISANYWQWLWQRCRTNHIWKCPSKHGPNLWWTKKTNRVWNLLTDCLGLLE